MDRNAKFQFAGVDTQLLWQESKTVCAPYFPGPPVLGKMAVEDALKNSRQRTGGHVEGALPEVVRRFLALANG